MRGETRELQGARGAGADGDGRRAQEGAHVVVLSPRMPEAPGPHPSSVPRPPESPCTTRVKT